MVRGREGKSTRKRPNEDNGISFRITNICMKPMMRKKLKEGEASLDLVGNFIEQKRAIDSGENEVYRDHRSQAVLEVWTMEFVGEVGQT
ncbi:hypothetical protein Nepgr_014943 [Nepenthes gracilis]|uniref:Uncharacterized protein n=1 Tax=Nepenthes gracilis TaxID=150966 RepID=A0AAD3SL46_NEPGR|nr:hypothetical protein Nepgr_014943 [Nepenthes gracilis]